MTDTEIIERVRKIYAEIEEQAGDSADWLRQYEAVREAGDRIEELRRRLLAEENYVEILNIENGHLQTDRNNLELRVKDINRHIDVLMDDNRRMRDERDHAVAALSEQIATLTRERDEARRWVCELWSEHTPGNHVSPRDYAMEKGWDCFKEESGE